MDSYGTSYFRLTFSRFVNISPDTEVQDAVVQVLFECLNPSCAFFFAANTSRDSWWMMSNIWRAVHLC